MDLESRLELIAREPTEEIVTLEELRYLLETKTRPKHYIGLEISGLLHLGSLVLTGFKINDMIKAGVECTVFLADWHTFINDKLQGDWDMIKSVAKYYEDAFRFFCPGINVVMGSELYSSYKGYWDDLIRFSKHITLPRIMRSLTIMGRSEKDRLDFAQLVYPVMQAVDIHALGVDIAHAGIDQRKVHMLVRDVFPKMGWDVPVAVHHHLLPGLGEPVSLGLEDDARMDVKVSSKMSKSKPYTSIFVHDDEHTIKEKMRRAWCPESIEYNPVLEIARYIIFHEFKEFTVERPAKYGGSITFSSYKELEEAYASKRLHALDLKNAVAFYINRIVEPVREYFKNRKEVMEVLAKQQ
ncbi:MAG: tyrosine--tRNA ligase [Candidatus Nitrosocaldus sp.]